MHETPLFTERGILQPTPRASLRGGSYQHDPLIFNLGEWAGRRRYLVIRDVGEDLEPLTSAGGVEFFSRADAVLFMFDPYASARVANQLRDLVPPPSSLGTRGKVLHTMTNLIGKTARPCRFDALQARGSQCVGQVMGCARGRWQPRSQPARPWLLTRNDGQGLHEEVRSLLTKARRRRSGG